MIDRNTLVVEVHVTEHVKDRSEYSDNIMEFIDNLCLCEGTDDEDEIHSFYTISTRWVTEGELFSECSGCAFWTDREDHFGEATGRCTGFVGRITPADWGCKDWKQRED